MTNARAAAALSTLALAFALPASAQVYGDIARVVSATPVTASVPVPKRECMVDPTLNEKNATSPSPVAENCQVVNELVDRVVYFDVVYEYNGRELRTRMPFDPGQQMPVNVEVRPPTLPRYQ